MRSISGSKQCRQNLVGAHDGAEAAELVLDGLDVGDELGDDGGPRLVQGLVPDRGPEADGLRRQAGLSNQSNTGSFSRSHWLG